MALSKLRAEDPMLGDVDRALGHALHGAPRHCEFDIVEHDDSFELITDVPGFSPSDVDVQLHNNVLTISSQFQAGDEKKKHGRTWRNERRIRHFKRAFTLPDNIRDEGISAKLDKGVLTVVVPKKVEDERPVPKRIKVATSDQFAVYAERDEAGGTLIETAEGDPSLLASLIS